jgi:hypothetical protein
MIRRVLPLIATVMMGASLVFTGSTSAHNIDLAKANILARDYGRAVRAESQGRFVRFTWKCVNAFPNHNHYVRCVIQYQNAQDKADGVYTCKESLEFFMLAHSLSKGGPGYGIWARHTSYNTCGSKRFDATGRPLG